MIAWYFQVKETKLPLIYYIPVSCVYKIWRKHQHVKAGWCILL